ncbi:MAG: SDR family NAD(P)-dependent oxidoreductase [Acidobacteria bacterium]|nr:SDR family NAD(P)-dependent oxidoreductase [Acidobacteriota bacterium]
MEIRFDQMNCVVTGGAGGIGLETAKLLRDSGAKVWILDRVAVSEPGVESLVLDLRDDEAFAKALDRIGAVDVAVLNAGICRPQKLEETTRENWQATLDINLSAVFFHLKELAIRMKQRRKGSMVLTASTNSFDGEADLISYNASKAGLLGILHTAANELGPYGIRVNAVCPGLIETALTASAFADERLIKPYFEALPLGRGGKPLEVANAIAFLASDVASYITGTSVFVDGGQMATKFGTWGNLESRFEGGKWCLS